MKFSKGGWIVKVCGLEIGEQVSNDFLILCVTDLPDIGSNPVGRSNQQSLVDALAIGFAEEFADIMLGDVEVRRLTFALNCPGFAVLMPED